MRKWMLAAAMLFLGSLAGCASGGGCGSGGCAGNGGRWSHAHGVCDCEIDEYCSSRSPWVRNSGYNAPPVEAIQPPAKLPTPKKELE